MPTTLCIHILSSQREARHEELVFFKDELWTAETEKQLLLKIQELLSTARPFSKSIKINIETEVEDYDDVVFQIKKKSNTVFEITHQKLSIREIEVLGLIMQGLTNNEIANKLFISFETVRSHRKNILQKTGAKNTASLIHYYHQTFFEK